MLERDFDIAFVAGQALREKQIQQNYRPAITVHKLPVRLIDEGMDLGQS